MLDEGVEGEVDSEEEELELFEELGEGVVELVKGCAMVWLMPVRRDCSWCCWGLMPWASMNWVRAEAMLLGGVVVVVVFVFVFVFVRDG